MQLCMCCSLCVCLWLRMQASPNCSHKSHTCPGQTFSVCCINLIWLVFNTFIRSQSMCLHAISIQTNKQTKHTHTQKNEQKTLYHISVNATLTFPATHWFNSFGFAGNNPDWWQIRLQHWGKLEQSRSNHCTPGKKTRQINGTEVDLSLAESPKFYSTWKLRNMFACPFTNTVRTFVTVPVKISGTFHL